MCIQRSLWMVSYFQVMEDSVYERDGSKRKAVYTQLPFAVLIIQKAIFFAAKWNSLLSFHLT